MKEESLKSKGRFLKKIYLYVYDFTIFLFFRDTSKTKTDDLEAVTMEGLIIIKGIISGKCRNAE